MSRLIRIVAQLVTVSLLFSACGGDTSTDSSTAGDPVDATSLPEPTVEPTPEPTATEIPTPEPTATETPTPEPTATEIPTPEPTPTEAPTPEPTTEPATEGNASDSENDSEGQGGQGDDPTADGTSESNDTETVVIDGAAIYQVSCAGCHGAAGEGARARSITGVGAFFATDDSPLVNLVTNGGTNMPGFGDRLTVEEIDAVVDWVVSTFA